jgi:hypothetical protein
MCGPTKPLVVARGAHFAVRFAPTQPGSSAVEAASPAFFAQDSTGFTALHRGFGAILASSAHDFIHIEVHDIAALRIVVDPDGNTALHAGSSLMLRAIARDTENRELAGSTPFVWSTSDATRLALEPTSTAIGAPERAAALNPGSVTVEASFENRVRAHVVLEVLP